MTDYPLISHGCWTEDSGSFSDWLHWRALLARAAHIGTEHVELGEVVREIPALPYEELEFVNTLGLWHDGPEDVLLVLLAHSDEEGTIQPRHTAPLADRLKELLPHLVDYSHCEEGSPSQIAEEVRTTQFIDGLLKAHVAVEPVTFGAQDE